MSRISIMNRLRNKIKVAPNNECHLEPNTRIRNCDIYIAGKNNRLVVQSGANIKGSSIELVGENCTLIIGSKCVIGENCYISCREKKTNLFIGKNCMFSRNVKIMTSDGHDITHNGERINNAKDVCIGEHVWLADNVTVLKGVSIGSGSIVGIHSVLTKNIPRNSTAAGNPAKVIAHNITWHEELTFHQKQKHP